ncbi:ABC transporter ATP-binding protein [Rhizobacter sp. Root1221]|uniref:ABC transporter ATP-binding protein n=1 Tax=Rhizobacter sp. Root1221 TaxID=1736433 RepID=UPI0006F98874|nr:ABC transporter ATP-binding protein [Rhizobacter sp. Root1221]KQV81222.1 methionine ABC transporter ATP-binding protein [Rhizobacter sp. Root1221]
MIDIQALRFRWARSRADTVAIEQLSVAAGRTLFLHGPSGSGKSTLLGLLAGVLVPQQGGVTLLGTPWASLKGARRDAFRADHVGYVFQQFNLLPYLGVLDNVLLPCRFSPTRQRRATAAEGNPEAAARHLLRQVGLRESLWHRPAAELSVGQQQRVAAARALIGQPEIVIADEPTSALDAGLRDDFMDVLLGQCRASGSTLVFVSHDERLAPRFDDRIALGEINRAAQAEVSA